MKMIFRNIILAVLTVVGLVACDKEGDNVYLRGFGPSELIATATDVVITSSNNKSVVLSLAWQNPILLSSDNTKKATAGLLTTYLQISDTESFDKVEESTETNLSKAFTGADLNAVAKKLGLGSGSSSALYFRICSTEGNNIPSAYSNVCKVNVTPFTILMNSLSVLSKAKSDTLATLYSDSENGIYTGFMKASAWQNCWFAENDGTVWGNYAVEGHAFELSDASDAWNCWFADGSGQWYVTVDTKERMWSALNIKELLLNGNAMQYNDKSDSWTFVIKTSEDNASLELTAKVLEFNARTGTDKPIEKTLDFAMSNGLAAISDHSAAVSIAKAGLYTVIVTIDNRARLAYQIKAGDQTVVTPETPAMPAQLYMYTSDGSKRLATLQKLSKGIYQGVYRPAQWENFKIVDMENNVWYGSDPSDLFTLSTADGNWNIWFKDDFAVGDELTVTLNLNTMKWQYEKK